MIYLNKLICDCYSKSQCLNVFFCVKVSFSRRSRIAVKSSPPSSSKSRRDKYWYSHVHVYIIYKFRDIQTLAMLFRARFEAGTPPKPIFLKLESSRHVQALSFAGSAVAPLQPFQKVEWRVVACSALAKSVLRFLRNPLQNVRHHLVFWAFLSRAGCRYGPLAGKKLLLAYSWVKS